jgi:hypothetical protein
MQACWAKDINEAKVAVNCREEAKDMNGPVLNITKLSRPIA